MQEHHNKKAMFLCVLVFMRHANDPTPLICQGEWHGEITHQPKGEKGFGYDPVFLVPELSKTAAELDKANKSQFSHRAKALSQLMHALNTTGLLQTA